MSRDEELPADLNLAWSDPQLDTAVRALARRDPQPALDVLAATRDDADRRELAVEVLAVAGQHALADLQTFAEERTADADRWLLLGGSFAAAAWTARGADVAERTSLDQFEGLASFAEQSRAALHHATELAPQDPVPWSELLRCAVGALDHDGELDEIFAQVQKLGPDLYAANQARLGGLTRKWYGSQEQALAFARQRTERLPAGHPLLALVAAAHIEGLLDGLMRGTVIGRMWRHLRYLANTQVRAEVDGASDRLLGGGDRYDSHPRTMAAHQMFAAFYRQADDTERARPHLERGGCRPMPWPWGYFGEYAEEFAAAREAAGLAG